MPKNAKKCRKNALPEHKFYCKFCNFSTCKNSNYLTHLKTKKHLNNTLEGNYGIKKSQKNAEQKIFKCDCGKKFKSNSGLWKHKKNVIGKIRCLKVIFPRFPKMISKISINLQTIAKWI